VARKLVLAVIDGLKPAMLDRAIRTGRAPALAAIAERGTVTEAAAAFPSVTPVCAASIATGTRNDRHHIPSMNWYKRDEQRYVEYGSSFSAARRFGVVQQLTDTVFNMNAEHLPADCETVFESLDDTGSVRTAGTTYLIYRGRHEHQLSRSSAITRLASQVVRRTVRGPRELFYADLFASRDTGCRGQFGLPGVRDQHTGCVGSYLVEHDLCDFLLFSLPDNDTHSHARGPHAQVQSIAHADRQLERLFHAGGGTDAFLDEWAVIVMADHSHAPVEQRVDLLDAFEDWHVLAPSGTGRDEAEIAVCPAQRAAMVYALVPEARATTLPRLVESVRHLEGVDLAMWRPAPREAAILSATGELRFAPGGDLRDPRGGRWSVEGDRSVLGLRVRDGVLHSDAYPDALARAWAALTCPTSGDVLLSAAPGYEFADWGGVDHVGGGSHGSLHAGDTLGALAFCGVDAPPPAPAAGGWSIVDVAPMIRAHFGLET
jgi:hypothetical protein